MNTNTLTRLLGAFVLGSLLVAGCGGNNGNGNNGNGNNGGGGTADTTHGAPAGSGAPAAQEPSSSAEVTVKS